MARILGKAALALVLAMLLAPTGAAQAASGPSAKVSVSGGAIVVSERPTAACNFFSVIIDGNVNTEYHGKAGTQRFAVKAGRHDVLVLAYCGHESTKVLFDRTVNVGYRTHVVQKGQTLWRIAVISYGSQYAYPEQAGHQWTKIAKANGIKGVKIRTGQVLIIP